MAEGSGGPTPGRARSMTWLKRKWLAADLAIALIVVGPVQGRF